MVYVGIGTNYWHFYNKTFKKTSFDFQVFPIPLEKANLQKMYLSKENLFLHTKYE